MRRQMRTGTTTGGARLTRHAALALAVAVAALGLLPMQSAQAAGAGVEVATSTLTGIASAALTPDGGDVFAGLTSKSSSGMENDVELIGTDGVSTSTTSHYKLSQPSVVPSGSFVKDALIADDPYNSGATTTVVVIETYQSHWWADVVPGWQGTVAPAGGDLLSPTAMSGTPTSVVMSPDANDAYVELASGAIYAVDLSDGSVSATPITTVANPSGGLVAAPVTTGGDTELYAGTYNAGQTASNVGAVERIPVQNGQLDTSGPGPKFAVLGGAGASTQPTALAVDAQGDVYVAGTTSIGIATQANFVAATPIDTSATPTVPLAVYPLSTISCGSLSLDAAADPGYLYCAPVRATDLHLYRFKVPADLGDGLTAAIGVPVSKSVTTVWGRGTGAGAYTLEGGSIDYVAEASLTTQPALKSAPQPPRAVQASAVQTIDPYSGAMGAGIQVRWTAPAVDVADVKGYAVAATAGAGTPYYCSYVTQVPGTSGDQYTCVVPGLVAGTAYTISVQSTTVSGLSSTVVLAPAPVYAGTPGATIAAPQPDPANPSYVGCSSGGSGPAYVVPSYTVSDSATGSGTSGSAILTWPTVNQDSCDPFTGQPLSSGVPNTTNPDGSKSAGVSYYVLSAIDTATGKAITCNASTQTARTSSGASLMSLAACGTTAAPAAAVTPANPIVPEMSARLNGLVAGHTYVFTVAANNSPGKPAGSSSAGTAAFSSKWTGVATYAVPDTDAAETVAVPGAGNVPIMDGNPASPTWDYVAGGIFPAGYLSQAGLYGGTQYADPADPSSPVDPSYTFGEPTAPTSAGITATSGANSIAVTWTATPNYTDHVAWGRQDVTGYTASAAYTDPTGKTTTKTCTVAGYRNTDCTIVGLTNGLPYFVSVQAKGGALGPPGEFTGFDGTDPATATSTAVTVVPVGYPTAPTKATSSVPPITAGAKPWGEATITWSAPTDSGGSPITAYEVVATPVDSSVASPVTGYVTIDPNLATALRAMPSTASATLDPYSPSTPTTYTFPQGTLSSQTTWTFEVAAHNAYVTSSVDALNSWGPLSGPSTKAQPNGAPLPPTKVKATVTPTSITASWVAPAFAGGWPIAYYAVNVYELAPPTRANPSGTASTCIYGTASDCLNQTPGCETAATTCTVNDASGQLADGASFYVTVQAYNQEFGATSSPSSSTGVGSSGTVLSATATTPSAESAPSNTVAKYGRPLSPANVTATPADKSIFVSWVPTGDPSKPGPDNGEGVITGYTATATAGATSKSCTVAPPLTSCNISGLADGTSYIVGVTEANAGAASAPGYYAGSDGAIAVTPGTAPAAPTGVTATANGGSVAVWWTVPKTTGGAAITQYVATVLPGGANCTVAMPAAPTCVIAGLDDGTNYTVTVAAVNSFGSSPESTPATFTPKGMPTEPGNVEAFAQDRSAVITWDAPAEDGGSTITGYEAVAQPTTQGNGVLQTCTSGTTTPATGTGSSTGSTGTKTGGSTSTPPTLVPLTCTITGLTDGAQYAVYVVAISTAGQGAKSAPSAPFTPVGAPLAPTSVVAYTDLGSPTTGDTTLHVGWTAPTNDGGSPISEYTATANDGRSCVVAGPATACDITGLQAGVNYTVTVVATNADNFLSPPSTASAPSAPAGPPGVPVHVVAVAAQNSVIVSWHKSVPHGTPITQYVLTVQPTGQIIYVNGAQSRAVITGLDSTVGYRVAIEAESGPTLVSGSSKLSNLVRPFATPNQVAKPKAKAVRSGRGYKIVLGWKKPPSNGLPITEYLIHRVGGRSYRVGAKKHRLIVKGLARGHTYAFWVAAVNASGRGGASASVVVKTGR